MWETEVAPQILTSEEIILHGGWSGGRYALNRRKILEVHMQIFIGSLVGPFSFSVFFGVIFPEHKRLSDIL